MYCPSCAAQNIDNAQFCRTCGAYISFLSKAMTPRSPEREQQAAGFAPPFAKYFIGLRRAPEKEQQMAEKGLRYSFIGAGFLLIAIIMLFAAPAPTNWALCFSMLCAAFPLLGSGIAKMLYVRRYEQSLTSGRVSEETQKLSTQSVSQVPSRNTSEIAQPASITEGTTKILKAPGDNQN